MGTRIARRMRDTDPREAERQYPNSDLEISLTGKAKNQDPGCTGSAQGRGRHTEYSAIFQDERSKVHRKSISFASSYEALR